MRNLFKLLLVLCTVFVGSCKARREQVSQLASSDQNDKLTVDVILRELRSPMSQISSLEQFVKWLPDYLFEPANYVLFKSTKSMCEGAENVDLNHPRVVTFDLSVPIFIAYTGKAGGSCANRVEIIQGFKPRDRTEQWRFEFRLIDFDDVKNSLDRQYDDCSECHGIPRNLKLGNIKSGELVPIWQMFDELSALKKFAEKPASWPRVYAESGALYRDEVDQFLAFVRNSKHLWPYARLKGEFNPPKGRATINVVAAKPGEKVEYVPYAPAIDNLDQFFTGFLGTPAPHLPRPAHEILDILSKQ